MVYNHGEDSDKGQILSEILSELIFWGGVCAYIFVSDLDIEDINILLLILARIFIGIPLSMFIRAIILQ